MKKVCIYVKGILGFPGASLNWEDRAVTWTHTTTEMRGEKLEYLCGPISRAMGQQKRAWKLFRTLLYYQGWEIALVGHSNGADVIVTALTKFPGWPQVSEVHLVCGACEADFNRNGLNRLLTEGRIGRAGVYVAGKDRALALAHTWMGRLLGYGVLGLNGARNVLPSVADRVKQVTEGRWKAFGHSECWADGEFEETMGELTGDSTGGNG